VSSNRQETAVVIVIVLYAVAGEEVAGQSETKMHYASDITRSTPVGGIFSQQQKDIYEIVLKANTESISAARPLLSNLELHLKACRIIASGLKEIGLIGIF
jgi:Xaa-Pro aminopeptidase